MSARPEIPGATDNKCGDNLTWKLDDRTLTISGTGRMWNYVTTIAGGPSWEGENGEYRPAPWSGEASRITSVVLENGASSIGDAAFAGLTNLNSVSIPGTVTRIGQAAFLECASLASVTMPTSVTAISPFAFEYCYGLKDVYYLGTEMQWNQIELGTFNELTYNDPLLNATIHYADAPGYSYKITEYDIPAKVSEYRDGRIVADGPFSEFTDLYIDGTKLTRGTDYTAEAGSTIVTIRKAVFERFGIGAHTIALEFLPQGGESEVRRTSLNYTVEDDTTDTPTRVNLPNGVKYVPYSWTPEKANGTYTPVGTLPSGLDLNAETGEVSGVPQTASTWEAAVRQTVTENGQTVTSDLIYVITVQDNTDDNVKKPNDYEIIDPVGTEIKENHFVLDSYRDETLVIDGPYQEFVRLLIDGKLLIRDKDYEAHEGSTVITIFGQTFANQGTGTHTIAAEFRDTQGTLKTVSQNYTVNITSPSYPRPSVPAKPSAATTAKPTDTAPKPAPEEPAQTPEEPEGLPFSDVSPANWFYDDVLWAYEGEIMTGVTAKSFAPQTSISQATIVTVLARMANVDLNKFSGAADQVIAPGQWYTEAAIWAKQSGLLPDYNVFTGNETISRDQMAIMLSKYLQSMGKDTAIPAQPAAFADAGEMSQAGNDAFQVLYAYNIFRGVGDGRMDPKGSATRAQFAALMHRISDAVK